MEPQPLISVIIPARNRAHTLPRLLDSLFAQSSDDLEVVIVDDASDDQTSAVVDYWSKLLRLTSIGWKERRGATAARNAGAAHSSGAYLAFVDSDDELLPWWVERVRNVLNGQNVDVATCCTWNVPASSYATITFPTVRHGGPRINWLAGSMVVSRELFFESGGYDDELSSAQHEALWLRIISCRPDLKMAIIDEPLVIYHRGSNGSIRRDCAALMQGCEHLLSAGYIELLEPEDRQRVTSDWHRIAAVASLQLGEYKKTRYHLRSLQGMTSSRMVRVALQIGSVAPLLTRVALAGKRSVQRSFLNLRTGHQRRRDADKILDIDSTLAGMTAVHSLIAVPFGGIAESRALQARLRQMEEMGGIAYLYRPGRNGYTIDIPGCSNLDP